MTRKARAAGKELSGTAYIKARRLALKAKRSEIGAMLATWRYTGTKVRKVVASASADGGTDPKSAGQER